MRTRNFLLRTTIGDSQYCEASKRSSSAMDARRALHVTNEVVHVKPFVMLAARVFGPGGRRLELVKFAHDLDDTQGRFVPLSHNHSAAGHLASSDR